MKPLQPAGEGNNDAGQTRNPRLPGQIEQSRDPASADVAITVQGEDLRLLPERAVYWPAQRTLIIADPHFGKAAAFRAAAVPVPAGTTADNLARLDAALARTNAERLICLGDLFHARAGRTQTTLDAIGAWRQQHAELELVLVRGNHDQRAGDPPASWRIRCVDEPATHDPPFVWRHAPMPDAAGYVLAGHLHPAVHLRGPGRQGMPLACFWFRRKYGVLPAFGDFTGTARVRLRPGDLVYVLAGDEIIAAKTSL